nr:MAG TPA: hypothetical protein [Caudoviricetes sp.]
MLLRPARKLREALRLLPVPARLQAKAVKMQLPPALLLQLKANLLLQTAPRRPRTAPMAQPPAHRARGRALKMQHEQCRVLAIVLPAPKVTRRKARRALLRRQALQPLLPGVQRLLLVMLKLPVMLLQGQQMQKRLRWLRRKMLLTARLLPQTVPHRRIKARMLLQRARQMPAALPTTSRIL